MDRVLVTGAAGFVGYHVCERLLGAGSQVVGLDNLSAPYDRALQLSRLDRLRHRSNFRFVREDVADRGAVASLLQEGRFGAVVHLAALVGVRQPPESGPAYIDANIVGFQSVLEACRLGGVGHLVYASSSSVYGAHRALPSRASESAAHPLSLYASTKLANESMAHAYAAMYGLPSTGLRFFTVYGPWGRPDMAVYAFLESLLAERAITLFNGGAMSRDFTYVEDVAEAVLRVVGRAPRADLSWDPQAPAGDSSCAPWRVYNVGRGEPSSLRELVAALERATGKIAELRSGPAQPGEVISTWADVGPLERDFGYRPQTDLAEGIARFVEWYQGYGVAGEGGGPAMDPL